MISYLVSRATEADRLPVEWSAFRKHTGKSFEVIALTLEPGQTMPLHSNNVDVLFGILSGCGRLLLEEETVDLVPGDWIEVGSGTSRGWLNTNPEPLELLVIKNLKV